MHMDDLDHISAIRTRTCANRDWQLLTCPELGVSAAQFDRCVAARLQGWLDRKECPAVTDQLIERAVIGEYCILLHKAIAADQTPAQQRSLDEIWNYVTPIIRRVLGDDGRADPCANDVLLTVWRKYGDVHDAATFLNWAGTIASNAALNLVRRGTHEVVFSDLLPAGQEDDDALPFSGMPVAFNAIEDMDAVETLAALIRRCLEKMRLAAEVVIRLVLAEQPVSRVSRDLGLTPGNIHVIKWRALRRLRTCDALLTALNLTLSPGTGSTAGGR